MNRKIKNAFDAVHADEKLKQTTKDFVLSEMEARQKKSKNHTRYLRFAAAFCMLVLLGAFGFGTYFTPVSTVSVDINPSVELSLNRFDKVVSVQAFNDDGDALKSSLNVKYMNYLDALNSLLENETVKQFMEQDESVTITVVSDQEETCQQMAEEVKNCTAGQGNIYCYAANSQEVQEAHDQGLSYGKYRSFLELQALDSTITIQDVQGLSMKEIQDWINDLSTNSSDNSSTSVKNKNSGNGNGQNGSSGSGNGYANANGNSNGNTSGYSNNSSNGKGYGTTNGSGNGRGKGQKGK